MAIEETELQEIRNYIEKSENPLIFFDDDHDGLSSFILFKKEFEKAHGVIVKSGIRDNEIYFRKIQEYTPDTILILDRAEISQELIDFVNVPLIWLDHHPVLDRKGAKYFNPRIHDKEDTRPTSYWAYKVIKKYLWIAMVGIIGDYYLPKDLIENFEYKELFNNKTDIEDILYNSDFGKLVKIFNFILKGTTTDVKKNINMLLKIENPYELLKQDTPRGKYLYNFYQKINKEFLKLLSKVEESSTNDKVLLFIYPDSKLSLSAAISSEIKYKFPDKLIIIAREKNNYMRISLRSNHVILPPLIKKALEGLDGYGGGHDHAVGANVNVNDFPKFVEYIKKHVQ